MRLAAVFIPDNSLPYIFGEKHTGQVLNLGGKYFYSIKKIEDSIEISRELNSSFIDLFWNKDIELFTAIVGRNGVGKTTLLRAINNIGDVKHINSVFVFEDNDEIIKVYNETKYKIISDFHIDDKFISNRIYNHQYYSPVLDFDLNDTSSSISLIGYANGTLEDYFIDSITRNIMLLSEPIMELLIENYPDFPFYDEYLISAKKNRKSHFRAIYIETNLGNPNKGDVTKNYLDGDISRYYEENDRISYLGKDVAKILENYKGMLEDESFIELFNKLWDLEEYKCENDRNYIHNSDNFIKNVEVTILSYLILGATFPQTSVSGGYDFDKVLNEATFLERLNKLLELYLANEHIILYNLIKKKLKIISIDKKEKIIEIIKEDKFSKEQGFDLNLVKQRMINDLEMFWNIKDFYSFLNSLIDEKKLVVDKGALVLRMKNNDIDNYKQLIFKYKNVLKSFENIPVNVSILEFNPNKKLSSGEKSLLEFYASLNDFIERYKDRKHQCSENYILLLDEPELGYHPLWKKKFVNAIMKTLPILFSKMQPYHLDENTKEYLKSHKKSPSLQIIFTTHDPLTLSDIPNNNIIYLDKNKKNDTIILNKKSQPQKSFGANITELLADSFFIEDGLIGDFAKEKINKTIDWLNDNENNENSEYHKAIIQLIDEPIIRRKLAEMYSEKVKDDLSKSLMQLEIKMLRSNYKTKYNEDI